MYLYANLVGLLIDALRADCMGCVLVGVQWEMQGYRLKFDLLAMELGAYDVVLGVDWMRKFPII